MFQGLQLDNTILEEAQKQAEINWRWWQDDFEHNKAFGKMPVFNDYPRFLGFGADYSVFRGLDTKQLEKLQIWFRNEQYPDSFGTLFRKFSNFANDESLHKKSRNDNWPNRISLISKLLCLWRPEEYAMWDTLARAGLKKLHNSTRAHCYSQTNENNYLIFREDFFKLHEVTKGQLSDIIAKTSTSPSSTSFSFRVLDSYLMKIGERAIR